MNHLMCVWTYAKTIGELEGLDRKTQETLEIAAITIPRLPPVPGKIRQY